MGQLDGGVLPLRLILPESKLNDANVDEHIAGINRAMEDYLARDIFKTLEGSIIYIERTQSDGTVVFFRFS